MQGLPPKLDSVDAWAEPLVAQALAERAADGDDYVREIRGDDGHYALIVHPRDRPRGQRGSMAGKPTYEIVLDRRTRTLERVSIAR